LISQSKRVKHNSQSESLLKPKHVTMRVTMSMSINEKLKETELEIESFNNSIKKKCTKMDELNDEISALRKQEKDTLDELDEQTRKELKEHGLQDQSDWLQERVDDLQKQTDGLRKDRESLETQLSILKGNLQIRLILETKKREGHELNQEKLKKLTTWKDNLKVFLQNTPSTQPGLDNGNILDIGSLFEFMNRDELLMDLYDSLENTYNHFHMKFSGQSGKPIFNFPICVLPLEWAKPLCGQRESKRCSKL
jgi:chaperonin cofactor prefoldin